MNYNSNKSFLPTINKKTKQSATPKTVFTEKKSSDPTFLTKTREYEKLMNSQQSPPKLMDKSSLLRLKNRDENEQIPSISTLATQTKKSSYASLTNIGPPTSTKKPDNSFRQSRYESLMRVSRDNKEHFPTENTPRTSISPEKKPKRISGPHTFR